MNRKRRPSQSELEEECAWWNERHAIGALVEYHPVIDAPAFRLRKTRTAAQVLSGHTAVVFLEDESGCVAIDACVPVAEIPPVDESLTVPPGARCQEASMLSKASYIPCGAPAVALIYHRKDRRSYYMCGPCCDHNVRNRGGRLVSRLEGK